MDSVKETAKKDEKKSIVLDVHSVKISGVTTTFKTKGVKVNVKSNS